MGTTIHSLIESYAEKYCSDYPDISMEEAIQLLQKKTLEELHHYDQQRRKKHNEIQVKELRFC